MKLGAAITRFKTFQQAEDRSPHTVGSCTRDLKPLATRLGDDPEVADLRALLRAHIEGRDAADKRRLQQMGSIW